ncbi:GntR family transcriptional regulator [Halospina denitrificans]|uniref:GntR family transcriptional regulator n=1 Tax=Halospina denitrificans TaxID=332522 RepID=A0A4V6Q2L9_9GAMM|nr:GntR family transcriptional regulator [Halospina denitrificans]TDT41598.1 GntR family transcriptional regulator [Halospina denitrificans]
MRFQAPESLSEQIAQHLGQQIITGTMRPGERIQELKVAGDLDVSRGSVREALLILERRHLIQIFPRKGAVVSALTPDLVNNLYDIYIQLLLMLADKFMEQRGNSDLEPLLQAVRDLRRRITAADASIEEVIEGGMGIMRKCYPIVNNPYLEETLENFRPAISRTYYLVLERSREETLVTDEFFARIGDRVGADDRQGVTAAIRDFGEHQRRVALDALEKDESLSLETAN